MCAIFVQWLQSWAYRTSQRCELSSHHNTNFIHSWLFSWIASLWWFDLCVCGGEGEGLTLVMLPLWRGISVYTLDTCYIFSAIHTTAGAEGEDASVTGEQSESKMTLGREFWRVYRGPGFLAVLWFCSSSIPTPPPLSRQQVVSFAQPFSVLLVELTDGRGGRGWLGSQITRPQESLGFSINHSILSDCESSLLRTSYVKGWLSYLDSKVNCSLHRGT